MRPIVHIVILTFKPDLSPESVKSSIEELLHLHETCISPRAGKPYMLSIKGGKDNSKHLPGGNYSGASHAFVMEFASVEDRDYFITADPVHVDYARRCHALLDNGGFIDFTHGEM